MQFSKLVAHGVFPVAKRVLPKGVRPRRTRDGTIYIDVTESATMLLRAFGRYEPSKRRDLRNFLKPGMTFIDVGGNRGDFSLLAARAVGPTGRVVTVEPAPENCDCLRKMIETNKLTNMEVVQAALWDEDGEGELHLATKTGWHSLTPRPGLPEVGTVAVRLVKLDNLVAELGIDRVDAVKIDVEGAEIQVLLGARGILTGFRPFVAMDIDAQRTAAEYTKVFESVDYEVRLPGGKELRATHRAAAGV
jgi:FkbM family methyltransferase